MTRTAARISWLVGPDREVYHVLRDWPAGEKRTCMRCGGTVTARGSGARRGVTFLTRERGTQWRHRAYLAIHRGCIPERGHDVLRIRARSLRASQVRAGT